MLIKNVWEGTSLEIQSLKTLPPIKGVQIQSLGGAKIPHASQPKNQNTKQKQYCNKFNKDFENGPHQKIIKFKNLREESE